MSSVPNEGMPGTAGSGAAAAQAGPLLFTGFRPGAGGIGRDMLNLINGCVEAGVEVRLLLESENNPDVAELAPGTRADVLTLRGPRTVADLADYLAQLRPAAVLSNRDAMSARLVATAAGLRPRPRVAVRVGSHIPAKLQAKNPFSRWRRRRRLLAAYRGADLLIAVSEGACAGLRELLGGAAPPIRRIYSPIDLPRIAALAAEEPTHPWFKGARIGPLLVSVGRLSRIKDQATMLRALARLPVDHRLVIFGEGKQRGELEALARRLGVTERLDLPGHTANPFAHVARADLFVLSSRFEGFGNALLEALIVGTPAVSTDCPSGPREILGGGRYGRLVPMADPDSLAAAIRSSLQAPPPPERLAEAVARMELDQAVPRYLEALGFTPARRPG